MQKWLLLVYHNSADPSREEEFNNWYDNIHVPDTMETQGFLWGNRYVNADPQGTPSKFLAAYEIESDDIDKTMASLRENMARKQQEGRYSELMVRVSRGLYKQISCFVSAPDKT
jgi:hypothetical protein